MASFFRGLGRTAKKESEKETMTTAAAAKPCADDDDLFSGLEIQPIQQPTNETYNMLYDLTLEDSSTERSAFDFLNEGNNNTEDLTANFVSKEDNTDSSFVTSNSNTVIDDPPNDAPLSSITAEKANTAGPTIDDNGMRIDTVDTTENILLQMLDRAQEQESQPTATSTSVNASSCSTNPVAKKANRKTKKRKAKQPGFGNIESTATTKSSASVKVSSKEEDTESISSLGTVSTNSLELANAFESFEVLQNESYRTNDKINQVDGENVEDIDSATDTPTCSSDTNSKDTATIEQNRQTFTGSPESNRPINSSSNTAFESEEKDSETTDLHTDVQHSANEIALASRDMKINLESAINNSELDSSGQTCDALPPGKREMVDVVTCFTNDECNLDIGTVENAAFDINALRSHQIKITHELSELQNLQYEFITKWKVDHLTEEEINDRKAALLKELIVYEADENYAKAAETQQQVQRLDEQLEQFKYQHPLLNKQFVDMITDCETIFKVQMKEKEELRKQCGNHLDEEKQRIAKEKVEIDRSQDDKCLNVKEERLNLERCLSHVKLDMEHIVKNEGILTEEICKKTKHLEEDKEKLEAEKLNVQLQIEELKKKLHNLQEIEKEHAKNISNIEEERKNIIDEFQPRIDKINFEKQKIETEESNLQNKMVLLKAEEDKMESEKSKLLEKNKRSEELVEEIESFMKTEDLVENENIFAYKKFLHLQSIETRPSEAYMLAKEKLLKFEEELQNISNQISREQTTLSILQRSLNDLETQLCELQKSKQAAAKERKYKEAQRWSDEIKLLTKQGEEQQSNIEKLKGSIDIHAQKKVALEELAKEVKNAFRKVELENDRKLSSSMKDLVKEIHDFFDSHPGDFITKDVMQLQLEHSQRIIASLEKRHSELGRVNPEEVQRLVGVLEESLKFTELEEDWESAERINNEITEKKALLETL